MKATEPAEVLAVRIKRKNGTSFFASADNSVIATFFDRKKALDYADYLARGMAGNDSVDQMRRRISVVRVTLHITVEK